MSSFLDLVQLLHDEVGAAGIQPTAVTSQTGEARLLVQWVANADFNIQMLWHNWEFLRAEFTTSNVTVDGTRTMSPPADLNRWDASLDPNLNTFFIAKNLQEK